MAKEYIEREAAKSELLSWAVSINHPEYLIKDDALHIIDSFPAADVAPVRHGRWIFGELGPVGCDVNCSECGWGAKNVDPVMWLDYDGHKHCGCCGAKMEGGVD